MAKPKKEPSGPAALEAVRAALHKKFGAESAVNLKDAGSLVSEVIPTGIDVLDHYILGIGGLAVGRISELYSEFGGGKSTLGLAVVAQAQKLGGLSLIADDEVSLNEERATMLGVDLDNLLVLQPDPKKGLEDTSMEASLNRQILALESIPNGVGPNFLLWDSLGAAAPLAVLKGEVGDAHMASKARSAGQAMDKLVRLLAKKRCHMMIINQVRKKIGIVFGDNTDTPGGNQTKFAMSIRLQILGGSALKNAAGQHVGKAVTFMATKNRFAPPFRKAKIRLMYASGFENTWSIINHAKDLGVIPKAEKATTATYERAMSEIQRLGWGVPGDYLGGKEKNDELEASDDGDE